jgi:hypothetical protein
MFGNVEIEWEPKFWTHAFSMMHLSNIFVHTSVLPNEVFSYFSVSGSLFQPWTLIKTPWRMELFFKAIVRDGITQRVYLVFVKVQYRNMPSYSNYQYLFSCFLSEYSARCR